MGFGGAEIGYEGATQSEVELLLNGALDAGLNVIDTAECYADSEEKIGRAVSHRRDAFHLFTKCGHSSGIDLPDWDPALLQQQIDRSLVRLKTDRLDLVQLHSCSLDLLRQGDVIDALQRAKTAGKTRLIGYSGDAEHAEFAVATGAFDTLQISVNIADQQAIDGAIAAASNAGMGIIAKRPIANVAWMRDLKPGDYAWPYQERLKQLQYEFLSGADAVETAFRFTLALPIHTAIVGTTKPGRWQENAVLAMRGPLHEDAVKAIRQRWAEVAPADWVGQT